MNDAKLDPLRLARESELILFGGKATRLITFELEPDRVSVDSDIEIGRARRRLRGLMSRVPTERDLAAFRVLKKQPVREVALFTSFVCILARRRRRDLVRRRVCRDTVSGRVLTAHQPGQVRGQFDGNPHRHFLHALSQTSPSSSCSCPSRLRGYFVCRETVSSTASGHVAKSRNRSSRTVRGTSVAELMRVTIAS